MPSAIVVSTAVASFVGFLINTSALYLVFSRRSRGYHLLFSAILLVCSVWDAGIFLMMVRNSHPEEIAAYGYVVALPCILLPALIFHFTESYLGLSHSWAVILLWIAGAASLLAMASGVLWPIEGVYHYAWGDIFRVASPPIAALVPISFTSGTAAVSCWLLYRRYKADPSGVSGRHALYVLIGFAAIGLAMLKVLVIYGIDAASLLPMGMILNDVFAAVIGLAIVKERLFDITLIVKKSAFYSALAAVVVFVFTLTEHALTSYMGGLIGGQSEISHFASLAIAVAVLLPVKRRLERATERFFEKKRFEF